MRMCQKTLLQRIFLHEKMFIHFCLDNIFNEWL